MQFSGQAGAQKRELEVHDLLDVGQRERLEPDGVVHAVQELGAEVAPESGHHLRRVPSRISPDLQPRHNHAILSP
jgi:hypothetical protein